MANNKLLCIIFTKNSKIAKVFWFFSSISFFLLKSMKNALISYKTWKKRKTTTHIKDTQNTIFWTVRLKISNLCNFKFLQNDLFLILLMNSQNFSIGHYEENNWTKSSTVSRVKIWFLLRTPSASFFFFSCNSKIRSSTVPCIW